MVKTHDIKADLQREERTKIREVYAEYCKRKNISPEIIDLKNNKLAHRDFIGVGKRVIEGKADDHDIATEFKYEFMVLEVFTSIPPQLFPEELKKLINADSGSTVRIHPRTPEFENTVAFIRENFDGNLKRGYAFEESIAAPDELPIFIYRFNRYSRSLVLNGRKLLKVTKKMCTKINRDYYSKFIITKSCSKNAYSEREWYTLSMLIPSGIFLDSYWNEDCLLCDIKGI